MPFSAHFQKLKESVKVAFAVPASGEPFSPEEAALLDRIAEAVVARGMAGPAVLFLESAGPMNFLGSQALHFLTPILNLACGTRELELAAHLLERRDALARLIAVIEAKTASRPPDSAKAAAR